MVVPDRNGQAEQRLQQAVDMGCREQVHSAGDQRDPIGTIVDRRCQVIARRRFRVLAHEHDIPAEFRLRGLFAGTLVEPGERSSILSRKRPPRSFARSCATIAEKAWPRCSGPFGLGAKRVTVT